MCGIVGIQGPFDRSRLERATLSLQHRGPDDHGCYEDSSAEIGLGHRRLSIIDLSPTGHQPMTHHASGVTIVYNGEVYNFRELRDELAVCGHAFLGTSDTEVVLAAYLQWGEAALPRLNGIFGLAIWDPRDSTLRVVRDALGVKPVYYSDSRGVFAFASELKALVHLKALDMDLDAASIHRYLTFQWCPGSGTPLRDVRKVLPGELLRVKRGGIVSREQWYRLPGIRGAVGRVTRAEAIEGVRTHLRTAVRRQMVSDVKVGAFLSGGLDSSAIVAFAREQCPDIRCFTIQSVGGAEEGVVDDVPYARIVARHLGVPLEIVEIDSAQMAGGLMGMVAQLDEPLSDPAPLNVLYISRLARQQDTKVLLSGAGGDDLFSGYRRHRAITLARYWRMLPLGLRRHAERLSTKLDVRKTPFRRVAKFLGGAELDGDRYIANLFHWIPDHALRAIYAPHIAEELTTCDADAPLLEFLDEMQSDDPLERMLALEQRFFLPDHNLIYTDKMSMAEGVETRVPYLDLELVEFSSRIRSSHKQRGDTGKWVLKQAMEPFLPREVIYRPKTGFGAPIRKWLRADLREMLGDLLSAESVRRRGLFSPEAVSKLVSDNDSGKIDASYTLFALLCVEVWCRSFLDVSPN